MHFIIFSFYQPVATGSYILYNNFSYKHQNIRNFSHFTCFAGRSVIIMYVCCIVGVNAGSSLSVYDVDGRDRIHI